MTIHLLCVAQAEGVYTMGVWIVAHSDLFISVARGNQLVLFAMRLQWRKYVLKTHLFQIFSQKEGVGVFRGDQV